MELYTGLTYSNTIMRLFTPKKLCLASALFTFILLLFASCSTDEISDEVAKVIETEATENPEENEEPNEENEEPEEEAETPTNGSITFEADFVLNEDRSFAGYVIPQAAYNKFITGEGDLKMVSKKIYEYIHDEFDFIIILSVEDTQPEDLFYGRSTQVSNKIEGLGGATYDNTAAYGSDGKLKSIIYMPRVEYVLNGPFLHEIAHSWGNKNFLPTTVGGHWGYAGVAGQLGGFDELVDLGGNSYKGRLNEKDGFGTFANGGNSIPYGNLELYLMGLISSDDLESVQVAVNPVVGTSSGVFTADAIQDHTPQAMIAENGARVPSHQDSQKTFRALTVILSTEKLEQEKMETIHSNLENFSRPSAPDASWGKINNFWMATQGKASFQFEVLQEHIK